MSSRPLRFLPLEPAQVIEGCDDLVHSLHELGGTSNRPLPVARNVAAVDPWSLNSDPMLWGLGVDVAVDVLTGGLLGILGPKR